MGIYSVIMAGAIAVIIAPPMAWNMRTPTSTIRELNMPGKKPQAKDPAVKLANPARNTLLNPIISETLPKTSTQPAITSRYAVETQLMVVVETENASARWSGGRC